MAWVFIFIVSCGELSSPVLIPGIACKPEMHRDMATSAMASMTTFLRTRVAAEAWVESKYSEAVHPLWL